MFGVITCTIASVVLLLVLVAYFKYERQFTGFRESTFGVTRSIFDREGFESGYPMKQLCTDAPPLTTPIPLLSGPGDATLNEPRIPYHLLGDYLQPAKERISNLTSEKAYAVDGQRLIEKTGSYGQVTNNYRHKTPDNGSTPLHELAVSFYKWY
jgi:hypothetical protein